MQISSKQLCSPGLGNTQYIASDLDMKSALGFLSVHMLYSASKNYCLRMVEKFRVKIKGRGKGLFAR